MDILLSHGYFIAEDAHEQKVMKPYPTLGLLYISSYLRSRRFDVKIFDSTFSSLSAFDEFIARERPSIVGLYCNLMTKKNILRMIRSCKENGAMVIVGGPDPPYYAEEYLKAGSDIVVTGEGELTVEELIPHLQMNGKNSLENISGISFLRDDGRLVQTPPRPNIKNLSDMPWPDREAIDLPKYLQTWKTFHGLSSLSLIMSRGCPYTCTWCSHSVFGETHRRREVSDVVKEIEWIENTYHPDQLWYADDVMTIHRSWFLQFASELQKRKIKIPFECISRADRLTEEIVQSLAAIGCRQLWIGSESGSQRILDAMQRRANVEDVQAKTKLLQKYGIKVGMFIMLGYDGEEISDIEATTEHLKKSLPDVFLTTVSYPIKGTKYFQQINNDIRSEKHWNERTDRDWIVNGRYSRKFYQYATRWMVNEVEMERLRTQSTGNYSQIFVKFLKSRWGRLGMHITKHKIHPASGEGWKSEERLAKAW